MLDPGARVPLYLQLAQLLRQAIMAGQYAEGDTLPGEHALSGTYRVSVVTARNAMEVLREEGLVTTRRGAGSIVATVPPRITIEVTPDTEITARMPTADERAMLKIAEGVPVISVKRGGKEMLYDATRAVVKTS